MPFKIFDQLLTASAVLVLVVLLPLVLLLDLLSMLVFRTLLPAAFFLMRVTGDILYRQPSGRDHPANLSLRNAELDNLDLHDQNFAHCDMENVNLAYSDLSKSSLEDADRFKS